MFSDALPYYYFEIAQLLINECSDEIPSAKQVKSMIEDIFDVRKEKLMRILKNIDPETPVAFMSTVGSAELNYYRSSFSMAYSVIGKMQNVLEESQKV